MKRFKIMGVLLALAMMMSIGLTGCETAAEQGMDDEVGSYEDSVDSLPDGAVS